MIFNFSKDGYFPCCAGRDAFLLGFELDLFDSDKSLFVIKGFVDLPEGALPDRTDCLVVFRVNHFKKI